MESTAVAEQQQYYRIPLSLQQHAGATTTRTIAVNKNCLFYIKTNDQQLQKTGVSKLKLKFQLNKKYQQQ